MEQRLCRAHLQQHHHHLHHHQHHHKHLRHVAAAATGGGGGAAAAVQWLLRRIFSQQQQPTTSRQSPSPALGAPDLKQQPQQSKHHHLRSQLALQELSALLREVPPPPATGQGAAAGGLQAAEVGRLLLELRASCTPDSAEAWQDMVDEWQGSASRLLSQQQQQQHQVLAINSTTSTTSTSSPPADPSAAAAAAAAAAASGSPHSQAAYEFIVFGGGGARCLAFAGALHALKNVGLVKQLRGVSGSSGGAVLAILAALSFSVEEVQDAMGRLPPESELSFLGLNRRLGLSDGAALFDNIEAAIAAKLGREAPTLGDVAAAAGCSISLAATSLARRAPVYLSSHSHPEMLLRDALRASCAIPFFFSPLSDNGDLLVDGCISDCAPLAGLHLAAPGGGVVDPERTLILAVHDASGINAPDFNGLLHGLIATLMQAGYHHSASAGIDLLNLHEAAASINPLNFRLPAAEARAVVARAQALAEAFAANKMRQRQQQQQQQQQQTAASDVPAGWALHHHHDAASSLDDWHADSEPGAWRGVEDDDAGAHDDDEPFSPWWRQQLQEREEQRRLMLGEQGEEQQQHSKPAFLRPPGLSDADWALIESILEQQERLLEEQGEQAGLCATSTLASLDGPQHHQHHQLAVVETGGVSRVVALPSSPASSSLDDTGERDCEPPAPALASWSGLRTWEEQWW